ncbi:hypothetical protein H180DRAFT_03531 [Streptomyces sp. WMMB 322]|nr:hypothetical protein H180DRAFT_03531 [Streptomyces sp. WMMB 322]
MNFNQQGQQVNGPQYNADQINIGAPVSPEVIAEAIRRHLDPPSPTPKGMSSAEIQRRREENDLKLYGYRYYTRDRQRWLQTLTLQERSKERKRASDRTKHGTMPWRHHERILRAGKLPPGTSPADPRYLQAKREVERKEDKRERYGMIVGLAVMPALILIAVLDGAHWIAGMLGILTAVAFLWGYLLSRSA